VSTLGLVGTGRSRAPSLPPVARRRDHQRAQAGEPQASARRGGRRRRESATRSTFRGHKRQKVNAWLPALRCAAGGGAVHGQLQHLRREDIAESGVPDDHHRRRAHGDARPAEERRRSRGGARRRGVHETTLYRRWGNKENLILEAMLEHGSERVPIPDTAPFVW
jgi:hypothetical protein